MTQGSYRTSGFDGLTTLQLIGRLDVMALRNIVVRRNGPFGIDPHSVGPAVKAVVNFTPKAKRNALALGIPTRGQQVIVPPFPGFTMGRVEMIPRDLLVHLANSEWARVTVLEEK